MTQYLFDTNAVIALLKNSDSPFSKRTRTHSPQDICISSIVIYELFYGAFKSQRSAHNLMTIENLLFEVIEFDKEDARQAGEIRAVLASEGKPIGPYDVLIAGQAKARSMILITHNAQEFNRVKGLVVEDWENG